MREESPTAAEARELLVEGNRRFVAGSLRYHEGIRDELRRSLIDTHRPVAVVVGCSDARVPVEIVFDQGPGDLFVVRVAGNVVNPSQIGSVELAAELLGTRLVVVLGHTGCAAVRAALARREGREISSPNQRVIVERVHQAIAGLAPPDGSRSADEQLAEAVRANARASARALLAGSDELRQRAAGDGLEVVPACYDLASGEVLFLD